MGALTAIASLLIVRPAGLPFQTSPSSSPPVAAVKPVTDDYYGTKVIDPYRYLENLADPEVQSWIKAQNDYTRAVLAGIPGRQKLLARVRELDQSASAQVDRVVRLGDLFFYRQRRAAEDVWKLYLRRGLNGPEQLLVDPERATVVAPNRTKGKNAIVYFVPSHDGKYVAVGIAPGGSETDTELHVIDTGSARETGDRIPLAVGGHVSWLPDNRAFVYGRLERLRVKYRNYLHALATDPEKDPPVFAYRVSPSVDANPRDFSAVITQSDSTYAVGIINSGAAPNSAIYVAPLDAIGKQDAVWRLVADFSDEVTDVAMHGNDLYLLTSKEAPRYKVIHTDVRNPDPAAAETIVPPSDAVITRVAAAHDALYIQVRDGGISGILRVPYGTGVVRERIPLPFDGAIADLSHHSEHGGVVFTMTSWTKAPKIYAYDARTRQLTDTRLQPPGSYDDPANLESLEVQVRSHDGTLVPLSIVRPVAKSAEPDGSAPTLLTAYGAYGYPQSPLFVPSLLAWYEQGAIWAICHVRGGGEFGEEWHRAGKGPTKSNTWRDFIACAEYLVEKRYTSPARLAGEGVSAGGIPVGRAITDRPDLFGAALINAGLSDMVRNETTLNGIPNIPEFGSVKSQPGFEALHAMSPYAHVRDGVAYPAVLLVAGMNDPRVEPWHSAKMAARLRAATTSGKPVLLRVDYKGGHLAQTQQQQQEQLADEFCFLLWQSGIPAFQPSTQQSSSDGLRLRDLRHRLR
jgi:prolyl oligopeptidase